MKGHLEARAREVAWRDALRREVNWGALIRDGIWTKPSLSRDSRRLREVVEERRGWEAERRVCEMMAWARAVSAVVAVLDILGVLWGFSFATIKWHIK